MDQETLKREGPVPLVAEDLVTSPEASTHAQEPEMRPFMGSQVAKADAIKQGRNTARLVMLGGVLVAATTLAFAMSRFTQEQAPEIKLPAADVQPPLVLPPTEAKPSMNVVDLEALAIQDWPAPLVVAEALTQIQLLKKRLAHAEEGAEKTSVELAELAKQVQEAQEIQKQQTRKIAQLNRVRTSKETQEEEVVALSVLDVSPERVIVSTPAAPQVKVAVTTGAKLPGGAVFIGFDPKTRLMKTDRGEFLIR